MVSQRVNAERVMLLAWPRAILLQVAHPLVAAGVAEHSSFADGGFAAVHRLWQTVQAMLALSFGDEVEQQGAIKGILAIHRRVHGTLREAVGPFAAGTRYSAEDPDLVLWVHVTLLESMVLAHDALLSPLSGEERDAYCAESAWVPVALLARKEDVPTTWQAAQDYLQRVHASGTLAVGRDGRAVGQAVLSPPLGPLAMPLTAIVRFLTRAWLPEDVRRLYGLSWSEADARRLPRVLTAMRAARRVLPARAAQWSESRKTVR
ncbi:MAG TPA: oxygenase MpaB family protein [Vicinamibacterales bacterium]|nr:oxygenase MpaB family protein [Vicinamibacterales bacterium]